MARSYSYWDDTRHTHPHHAYFYRYSDAIRCQGRSIHDGATLFRPGPNMGSISTVQIAGVPVEMDLLENPNSQYVESNLRARAESIQLPPTGPY